LVKKCFTFLDEFFLLYIVFIFRGNSFTKSAEYCKRLQFQWVKCFSEREVVQIERQVSFYFVIKFNLKAAQASVVQYSRYKVERRRFGKKEKDTEKSILYSRPTKLRNSIVNPQTGSFNT
jgi:hypothetical protein